MKSGSLTLAWLLCIVLILPTYSIAQSSGEPAESTEAPKKKKKKGESDLPPPMLAAQYVEAHFPYATHVRKQDDGESGITYTLVQDNRATIVSFDKQGLWRGTSSILNDFQIPAQVQRVVDGMQVPFKWKLKIERPESRPAFVIFTENPQVIQTAFDENSEEEWIECVFGGMLINNPQIRGKLYVVGEEMGIIPPEEFTCIGLMIAADGYALPQKELKSLLEAELIHYPGDFKSSDWRPGSKWSPNDQWIAGATWEPQASWYPSEGWIRQDYVASAEDEAADAEEEEAP
ncbi:hypothetical protein [Pontibacter sp. G13]|uniref:hypothetical protein n=1 Tax=Pontibacter sp. G13 TaxID=3074898 RepID=UPI002889C0C9|nr:hypothetical protein [Pontibacter sp. G13]WNJ19339.1 hypothetical protein RJD25_02505 [Pontibacter sp. G13]